MKIEKKIDLFLNEGKANDWVTLSDIPDYFIPVFEPAFKGGLGVTVKVSGNIIGTAKSINKMGKTYRIYIKNDKDSGEYRFDKDKARKTELNFY